MWNCKGRITRIKKKHGSNFSSDWWLRSDCVDKLPDEKVGVDRLTAAVVVFNGGLSYCSVNDEVSHGVSPAFYVDMDRIVFYPCSRDRIRARDRSIS